MERVVIVCVIALTVIVAALLILLGILLYNQMLATNEVNKRLLLIAKESIDKERSTQEELQAALVELDRAANENQSENPKETQEEPGPLDEPFVPHSVSEGDYRED